MSILLDGKLLSEKIEQTLINRIKTLKEKGIIPGLTVILVGEDPASQVYVRNKMLACERLGIHSKTITLPADVTQKNLESTIKIENKDQSIHGILVQLPLPSNLDSESVLDLISPEKDVDGFNNINIGKLMRGLETTIACTPKGAINMIKSTGIDISGKEAVIVGRSNIVGKPMAMLLMQENATVTVCHSKTKDLKSHTKNADILVAAIGKPNFITVDMVKPGAIVIDVGINRVNGKLCGDVDFEHVKEVAGAITPVPGGVGKMTIAMLMENTVQAAEKVASLNK